MVVYSRGLGKRQVRPDQTLGLVHWPGTTRWIIAVEGLKWPAIVSKSSSPSSKYKYHQLSENAFFPRPCNF